MFDLNITLNTLFDCFRKKKRNHELKLEDLKNELKDLNKKSKIKIILQNIVNGYYDIGLLFENSFENSFETKLICLVGHYDINITSHFNILVIPIFKGGVIRYSLTLGCIKSSKVKMDFNEELISLLNDILD